MEPLPKVTSKPPCLDELLYLRQTFPADAAGDVV